MLAAARASLDRLRTDLLPYTVTARYVSLSATATNGLQPSVGRWRATPEVLFVVWPTTNQPPL